MRENIRGVVVRMTQRSIGDFLPRHVREATVALCKRDSCKQEPAIMHRVLSFLAAPGFDMPLYSDIFLHCVANGCRAQTVAVTSFFTMRDNFIRMSGKWQVAGRLSGQFARRPSACFEK